MPSFMNHPTSTVTCTATGVRTQHLITLITGLLLCIWSTVGNAESAKAYLAGGCFWCMEADFEKLEGVSEVVSGFSGGELKNPTYKGNHKGHYETVEIIYNPKVVSYQQLLEHFWINIDPFDAKGQFCDKGHSYKAAIFVADQDQRALAEAMLEKVKAHFPGQTVVMPILDKSVFYPIQGNESYHQNYYKHSKGRYTFYRTLCGRDRRLEKVWGKDRQATQKQIFHGKG